MKLTMKTLAGIVALTAFTTIASAQTILFNRFAPPRHPMNTGTIDPWLAEIEKVTQGRVKIKSPAKSLAAPPAQYNMVINSTADGAYIFHAFLRKSHPLMQISILPKTSYGAKANAVALWRTYKKFFEKKNEYRAVKLLGFVAAPAGQFMSLTNKPLTKIEDFERLKIWTLPAVVAQAVGSLDTVVVPGPAVRVYGVVSKGTVKAMAGLDFVGMYAFKLDKLVKSATTVNGGIFAPVFSVFLSKSKWNAISKKDQAAIMKISGEALAKRSSAWDDAEKARIKKYREDGGKIFAASAKLEAHMDKKWAVFGKKWIQSANKLGIDGKAAFDYYIAEAKNAAAAK